jgi:hypothetical protein
MIRPEQYQVLRKTLFSIEAVASPPARQLPSVCTGRERLQGVAKLLGPGTEE